MSTQTKRIVTVQDISCVGQCSVTAALPILSAYGIETAILPSAVLSTHTGGFTGFTVLDLTDEMGRIVSHWKKEEILFDSIYTGYIGDARQFDLILDMKKSMLRPGGCLMVDPAMADNGKLYAALNDDIVDGMRRIVREADVILPNLTEAAFLLGVPYDEKPDREKVLTYLRGLSAMGPKVTIITGVSNAPGKIGAIAYDRETDRVSEFYTEQVDRRFHGTGDVFSSVAIANLLQGVSVEESIKDACEFVAKAIQETLPDPEHFYGVHFEPVLAKRRGISCETKHFE